MTDTIEPGDLIRWPDNSVSAARELAHALKYAPNRLTLRDQFAMAALPGLLAKGCCGGFKEAAEAAFEIADAMMKERQK